MNQQRKAAKYATFIQALLAKAIYQIEDKIDSNLQAIPEVKKLMKLCSDTTIKQLILDELVKITNTFEGKEVKSVRALYFTMKMHTEAIRKTKSSRIQRRIEGIRLLSGIRFSGASEHFIRLSTDSNQAVKDVAIIANIHYAKKPLNFLDDPHTKLSRWDAINIQSQLSKMQSVEIPNFGIWLDHSQLSVVHFSLMMIREYQQYSALKALKTLFRKSDHPTTLKLILHIIKDLHLVEMEPEVVAKLKNGKNFNRKLYVKALYVLDAIGNSEATKLLLTSMPQRLIRNRDTSSKFIKRLRPESEYILTA